MLINYIYLDQLFDSIIFKPDHFLFIPVLGSLEWFPSVLNADLPCLDLKRNKLGNPSRIVSDLNFRWDVHKAESKQNGFGD